MSATIKFFLNVTFSTISAGGLAKVYFLIMETVLHRLEQLRDIENIMHSNRTALLDRRLQENRDIQANRDQQDELWIKQLEARDREEDVSGVAM